VPGSALSANSSPFPEKIKRNQKRGLTGLIAGNCFFDASAGLEFHRVLGQQSRESFDAKIFDGDCFQQGLIVFHARQRSGASIG
jgi:hypothetical protein